jgi:hypothetical protein
MGHGGSSSRRQHLALALGIVALLIAAAATARPGSGQSYSGGSRSGGGGGGGGSGDGAGMLIQLLIWLLLENPAVGVPILLIVIIVAIVRSISKSKMTGWSTTPTEVPTAQSIVQPRVVPRVELDQIRAIDPGFSVVLFEDFVYLLYTSVQRARAIGTASIAAYLSPDVAQNLPDPSLGDVRGIIVGAMRTTGFSGLGGAALEVEIEVEANLVEVPRSGPERRFYVVDRMLLKRATTARSRPYARARTLDCPNCGAPLEAVRGTECGYCRQNVGYGRFDWMVQWFSNRTCEPRGPLLTSDVPEQGTNLPTIVDPGAHQRFQQLQQRDPMLTWDVLMSRVAHLFNELQVAWSARDPKRIRPYVSDNLFQSMLYWIDLYLQQRCRNVNENARILQIELCNVLSDAHYDAVTIRLFATGLDYTLSDDGRVLSGSRSRPRSYSEYWTLIRGTNRKGPTRGDVNCPNCGAPLRVGMAGNCEHCQAKVTSGEFDWVLSRIEQDEAYSG